MTSISKLIIGGFKSIRDRTVIPIAPLTFLFGPNSAGKSAVLGAVNALRQRIEEGQTKRNGSSFDVPPQAIASGAAYFGKERKAYADDGEEQQFGDYPNVTLGVEIEDFGANVEPEGELTKGVWTGRALYWAMDGASVQLEIEEYYWEDQFRDSCSSLVVDQVELLKFHTCGLVGAFGMAMTLDFERWHANSSHGSELKSLGVVSINLAHPIWSLRSIDDGSTDFSRLSDKGDAIKWDKYRIQLAATLKALKAAALATESPFLRQFIVIDGDQLRIRTDASFLKVKPCSPASFYYTTQPSFADLWRRAGLNVEQEEQNLSVIEDANDILGALSALGSLVLASTAECLRVNAVDGDRQVLKPVDVTAQFPDFHINHLAASKFWTTNWGRGAQKFSFYGGPEANSYLSLYAFWLGSSIAGNPAVSPVYLPSLPVREDFVNYVLKMGVFGTRRYEVKPEVWSITTKALARRNVQQDEDDENEATDLKVQLYLEDQNGRRLDFSEVGSGISYVMPILASLHCARTSWVAQPELHLHPAAQCEMGDVFMRAFNRGHFSVVETHSEHLLLRVLRRIRQTTKGIAIDGDLKCPPEMVSVLYFDPQEDGSTQVKQMRVTRLGDFKDRWPNGFFEERGRELFDE